jgi:predicted ATP-dependent endonuclease of OLD family
LPGSQKAAISTDEGYDLCYRAPRNLSEHLMINSVEIKNFKCFRYLRADNCKRINVIVGDNGAGKTALLEAMFWALGTTSELAVRYRQQRGLDGSFSGPPRRIEEAIWRDYFYDRDWNKNISVDLIGSGPEARSVRIFRGPSQISLPLSSRQDQGEQLSGSITIIWRDGNGVERTAQAKVGRTVDFESTDEDLADFFYFASNVAIQSTENAGRFSELSRSRRAEKFISIFTTEYDWIENLEIEVSAGAPLIYATIKGKIDKIPLPNVSGGINRIIGVLLGIASRSKSVVLVDEMENGVYYKHHRALWGALLHFTRAYETQLFLTTHSEEWLKALISAAANDVDDIALWRIERGDTGQHDLFQFTGETLKDGLEQGAEARGGTE